MAADGSIVVEVELDDKKAQSELNKLTKEIDSLNQKVQAGQEAQAPLIKQAEDLRNKIAAAKVEAEGFRQAWLAGTMGADKDESAALAKVNQLQAEYNGVLNEIEKYDKKIAESNAKLNVTKEKAGEIQLQLAKTGVNTEKMASALERAQKGAARFSLRLREVVRSALVFTLISQSLASFRNWMGKVINTNAEATASIARLKGALLTLAQPLVEVIIPVFTAFVNILAKVISTIAQLFAMLTGKTISSSKNAAKALNGQTKALEETGGAAEDAAGSLAGFDEVNAIATEDAAAAGGGGAESEGIAPTFDFDADMTDGQLENILNLIELIGAALLAWKLSKSFGDALLKTVGLFLAINGGVGLLRAATDAWINGVTWDNFLAMLGRAGEMVAGLTLAFGSVGAGIGLIVSGLILLATGFHDAFENGWNLQNLFMSIAGILATGIGIAILTGSFIPALIAGIAALLLAITVAFGDGEKLIADAKLILDGFLDFFVGIFTGDIDKAIGGIGKIFDGLRGIVDNVLESIKNMFFSFLDWLDEKTGGQFSTTIQFVKDLVGTTIDWMRDSFSGFADSIQQIFEGIVNFLSGVFTGDWDKAWDGLVEIGKGAVNLLISMVESFVNFWINGLNTLIRALNTISFEAPDWVPVIGGKSYGINIPLVPKASIPRLATGAVIPPNREFMAVLGDQTSGNNIEAPETLIRKIVREESGGDNTTTALLQAILDAVREGKILMVDNRVLARVAVKGINSLTQSAGKSVLLL